MDVAVIGCGKWGINHVRVLRELGVLKCVCDVDPGAVEKVEKLFPDVAVQTDIEAVLASPDLRAVVIATSAVSHAKLARLALLAGKDVLVEKPLALSVGDAAALVQLAEERKRILMVGHLLHYHPAIEKMVELIKEGALGKIYKLFSARMNWGSFRTDENVLWSFAPHDLSLFRRFAGVHPVEVWCHGEDFDLTTPGIYDTTLSLLKFPNGILGEIKVSWINLNKEHRIVITGSSGMLVFTDSDPTDKLKLIRRHIRWLEGRKPQADPASEITVVPFEAGEPLRRELEHFLTCIRTRQTPRTDGREGLAVLSLLDASQESLDRGGAWIRFDRTERRYQAHETSIVHPDATVGAGTKIWHHAQIAEGAVVGERCGIGHNCVVYSKAVLGNGVKLESNIDVWPLVTLEDNVFVGPSAVFTNDLTPRAAEPKGGKWVPTLVKRGASIGANATIVCGVTIGEYAAVAAGAIVTKDVPAHALVAGTPASFRKWICRCNRWTELHFADATTFCSSCGLQYRMSAASPRWSELLVEEIIKDAEPLPQP